MAAPVWAPLVAWGWFVLAGAVVLPAALLVGTIVVAGRGVEVGGKKTAARVGRSVGRWVGTLVGSAVSEGSTVEDGRIGVVASVAVGLIATIWEVLCAVAVLALISGSPISDWTPENR